MEAAIGHNSQAARNNDWIAVYRSLRTHPIIGFLNPDGTRRKSAKVCQSMAWIDLCMEANWKDRHENNNGQMVLVERGQLQGGRNWLAQRWGWTENQVRWFLKKLQDEGMLVVERPKITPKSHTNHTPGTTKQTPKSPRFVNVITICNYNIYQAANELNELLNDQANHQTNNQTTTKQPPHSNKGTKEQDKRRGKPHQGVSPPPPPPVPCGREEEDGARAMRRERISGDLVINCTTISGPGFSLDLKACELEVQMAGLPVENTAAIAEVVARDWVASKARIRYPAAAFRQALVSRRNQSAIENARLDVGLKRATQHPQVAQLDAAYERMKAKKRTRSDA